MSDMVTSLQYNLEASMLVIGIVVSLCLVDFLQRDRNQNIKISKK